MTSTSSMSEMTVIESYDEDISQNVFLVQLQDRYPQLHETTANNRWMICVPRSGSQGQHDYKEQDFLNHILIQLDHKPGSYKTLSDKEVVIKNNVITARQGFPEERTVPILFEETFFNVNDESYRVVCVNQMLEGGPIVKSGEHITRLRSLGDCVELLWGRFDSRHSQKHVDELIEIFNRTSTHLEGQSLERQVDAASALFKRAMQIVLKDPALKRESKCNKLFMDNVKLAVETYVMHGVYRKLFKHISASVASQDSHLNKTTQNLDELQLKDLHVRAEFFHNIPHARRELCNLNRYSTPMGKLNCFRRVVKALMKAPKKVHQHDQGEGVPLTTDDLLPILVFLVVKAGTANWCANFTYMNSCRFSKSSNDDEFGFYLASLEAAIEHVSSGQLGKVDLAEEHNKNDQVLMSPGAGSLWPQQDSNNTITALLFQFVIHNNISGADDLLSAKNQVQSDVQSQLCHPLCMCEKCKEKTACAATTSAAVTIYSRDDRGFTVLHVAAVYGHTKMSDFLISKGAVVNATDYQGQSPLHVCCQKGHQGVTLLLLHHMANVNLQDNYRNTPLHLAASHGHEDCVKALVYYNPSSTTLDIDAGNGIGDTPLHLAAKWGYENIVGILLENGASAEVRNRKKQSPLHYAHNLTVARLIDQAINSQQQHNNLQPQPVSLSNQLSYGTLAASCPDLVRGSTAPSSLPRSPSTATIIPSVPQLQTVATNKNKQCLPCLTEKDKKMEKLFKSVADGDIEMVKFQLGWYEEDLDEELGVQNLSFADLCHPLCQCSKCQPVQKLTRVTSTGLHVNCKNAEGFTLLHVAAMHGHEVLLELLLKRAANVNEENTLQECTALHFACQSNKPKVVYLLVQHKAEINVKNKQGNTPLHYCCISSSHACAEILLKNGANVNQPNYRGNTPLHEAARWNLVLITQMLVRHGALINLRNKQHLTSVQLARNDRILRILCEAGLKQSQKKTMKKNSRRGKKASPPLEAIDPLSEERPTFLHESLPKDLTGHDLFAAKEEDLQHLAHSIQSFDTSRSLSHIVTRDRSAPRLDHQLLHQLNIQNFNPKRLRHIRTTVTSYPVVFLKDDAQQEMHCFPNQYDQTELQEKELNSSHGQKLEGTSVMKHGDKSVLNKKEQEIEHINSPSVKDAVDIKMNSLSITQILDDTLLNITSSPNVNNVSNYDRDDVAVSADAYRTGDIEEHFTEKITTRDSDFFDKDCDDLLNTNCIRDQQKLDAERDTESESENSNTESHEDWAEHAELTVQS